MEIDNIRTFYGKKNRRNGKTAKYISSFRWEINVCATFTLDARGKIAKINFQENLIPRKSALNNENAHSGFN